MRQGTRQLPRQGLRASCGSHCPPSALLQDEEIAAAGGGSPPTSPSHASSVFQAAQRPPQGSGSSRRSPDSGQRRARDGGDTASRFFHALNARDWHALRTLLSPECVLQNSACDNPALGADVSGAGDGTLA